MRWFVADTRSRSGEREGESVSGQRSPLAALHSSRGNSEGSESNHVIQNDFNHPNKETCILTFNTFGLP